MCLLCSPQNANCGPITHRRPTRFPKCVHDDGDDDVVRMSVASYVSQTSGIRAAELRSTQSFWFVVSAASPQCLHKSYVVRGTIVYFYTLARMLPPKIGCYRCESVCPSLSASTCCAEKQHLVHLRTNSGPESHAECRVLRPTIQQQTITFTLIVLCMT